MLSGLDLDLVTLFISVTIRKSTLSSLSIREICFIFLNKAFVIFILKFDENERILELLADLVNRLVGFCIDGMDIFRQESSARSKSR